MSNENEAGLAAPVMDPGRIVDRTATVVAQSVASLGAQLGEALERSYVWEQRAAMLQRQLRETTGELERARATADSLAARVHELEQAGADGEPGGDGDSGGGPSEGGTGEG